MPKILEGKDLHKEIFNRLKVLEIQVVDLQNQIRELKEVRENFVDLNGMVR